MSMVKKLSFRIRRSYFDAIVKEEKNVEYRKFTPFWLKRLGRFIELLRHQFIGTTWATEPGEFEAVFICGKRIHRREIEAIARIKTPDYFSAQGKKDVNTETCLVFHLGKVIQEP